MLELRVGLEELGVELDERRLELGLTRTIATVRSEMTVEITVSAETTVDSHRMMII